VGENEQGWPRVGENEQGWPPPHDWQQYVGEPSRLASAETLADSARHVDIRGAFVMLMVQHPTIASWARRAFARAPFDEYQAAAIADGADGTSEAFQNAFENWSRSAFRSLRRALITHFPKQKWPWLFNDLAHALSNRFFELARGDDHGVVLDYRLDEAPAVISVETRPSESSRALAARLIASRPTKKPRIPLAKLKAGTYQRYALWYFCREVLGESEDRIARHYHNEVHAGTGRRFGRTDKTVSQAQQQCDDRPTIRYGIKQARRLLAEFPSHKREKTPTS
jgi:hypothetical protein